MPTVKLPPDSNVTSEPPNWSSRRHYPGVSRSHIYLAVGALFVLCLVFRFVSARKARSRGPTNQSRIRTEKTQTHVQDGQANYRKDSPASYTTRPLWAVREGVPSAPGAEEEKEPEGDRGLGTEFGGGRALQGQVIWATGLLRPALPEGNWGSCGPLGAAQAMDGRGDQRWDAASGPGQQASRGVSTSPGAAEHLLRHQESPSPADTAPGSHAQRRRNSRSSGSPTSAASRRHSGSSDGTPGTSRNKSKAKGKAKSTEHSDDSGFWPGFPAGALGNTMGLEHADGAGIAQELGFVGVDMAPSRRLPPPPPITPPTLSMGAFTFQDRRPGYAVSIPPQLDTSFVHQPNPDYFASSTSADVTSSSPKSATSSPGTRRRSYNKSVPIGIPNTSSASSQGSSLALTSADAFSPASYPPTSPLLPPPPPGHEFGYDPLEYAFDDPNAPPVVGASGEIDLQGEIISVMDNSGRGWKRHTRVYGGGVCLACVASGGQHGGFYGDKVPPEQRR